MTISKYDKGNDIHRILELLKDEDNITKGFHQAISSDNDSVYIAECDGIVAGILIIHRQNRISVATTVFVDKERRHQGIGSELLRLADQILIGSTYEHAECSFALSDSIAQFLEKRGYIRYYTLIRMERNNELISPEDLSDSSLAKKSIVIRNYKDEDFWEYHNIVDVGFYLMRKKACGIQWYNLPSEYDRKLLAENCNCRYVLEDHGEIIAICKIFNNDIALLGVRPDKQLQGYGTLMLSYFINKIIGEQQADNITIGVLKDNPAEKLYRKMGFQETSRSYDYVKFYKPDSRPKAPIGYGTEKVIMEAFRLNGKLKEDIAP